MNTKTPFSCYPNNPNPPLPKNRDGSACSSFTLDEGGEKKWVDFEPLAPGEKEFTLRNRQVRAS